MLFIAQNAQRKKESDPELLRKRAYENEIEQRAAQHLQKMAEVITSNTLEEQLLAAANDGQTTLVLTRILVDSDEGLWYHQACDILKKINSLYHERADLHGILDKDQRKLRAVNNIHTSFRSEEAMFQSGSIDIAIYFGPELEATLPIQEPTKDKNRKCTII